MSAYAAQPEREKTPALDAIGTATGTAKEIAPVPVAMPHKLRDNLLPEASKPEPEPVTASKERECLATAIYFEARGEPERGQIAVAEVILNRVRSPKFPDTICDVVYQNRHRRNACQFSFACDGKPDAIKEKQAWALAVEIAERVTSGKVMLVETIGATNYHASYVSPSWAPSMRRLARIGRHIFYQG